MSRSISSSVNILRSSLNSCKTSIANKGVTVPSTTKVSGLPALIDKIETVPTTFEVELKIPSFNVMPSVVRLVDVKNKNNVYTKKYNQSTDNSSVFFSVPQGRYDIYLGNSESELYKTDNVSVGVNIKKYLHDFDLIVIPSDFYNIQAVMIQNQNGYQATATPYHFGENLYTVIRIYNIDALKNPTVFYRTSRTSDYIECKHSTNSAGNSITFEDLKTKSEFEVPILSINTSRNTWNLACVDLKGVPGTDSNT